MNDSRCDCRCVFVCDGAWRHLGSLRRLVELRQRHQSVSRNVSFQDAVDQRRDGGEDQVEEDEHPGVGHDAPRETTEELIPEQQIHIHLQHRQTGVRIL